MKLCKTCKYWRYWNEYPDSFNFCGYIDRDDEVYPHNNHELVGIIVECLDDLGLDVFLRVEADFGCVHHFGGTE